MIILAGLVFGVLLGVQTARRRGGQTLDLLHYGAVYGIALAVLGVLITVIYSRMI